MQSVFCHSQVYDVSSYLDEHPGGDDVVLVATVPSIAHGLGTYRWLEEDVTTDPLRIGRDPYSGFVEASVADANRVLQKLQINENVVCRKFTGEQVSIYELNIDVKDYSCFFKVREVGQRTSELSRQVVHMGGGLVTMHDPGATIISCRPLRFAAVQSSPPPYPALEEPPLCRPLLSPLSLSAFYLDLHLG
ncbi:hypothetical protein FH972_008818 [Carpinus fangiana]|uniref:Cytochrome b5 heme-binding domain-containing protein n=1 Tax=Carpinus fangiana TaxID=176857 RepID=A0A5N6QZY1_9ROSI|nr:hypothetical protein FH972_008818 [Carpinus fangiana]